MRHGWFLPSSCTRRHSASLIACCSCATCCCANGRAGVCWIWRPGVTRAPAISATPCNGSSSAYRLSHLAHPRMQLSARACLPVCCGCCELGLASLPFPACLPAVASLRDGRRRSCFDRLRVVAFLSVVHFDAGAARSRCSTCRLISLAMVPTDATMSRCLLGLRSCVRVRLRGMRASARAHVLC